MKLTDQELKSIQALKKIKQGIDTIKEEFAVIENSMIKKYGKDSSINMQTGEVKSAEDVAAESETKPLEKVE